MRERYIPVPFGDSKLLPSLPRPAVWLAAAIIV